MRTYYLGDFSGLVGRKARVEEFSDAGSWSAEQRRMRQRLEQLLGGFPDERCALEPEIGPADEFAPGLVREKVVFSSTPQDRATCLLIRPGKPEPPVAGVVAFHGHCIEKGGKEQTAARYAELARSGVYVLCPDSVAFAERAEPGWTDERSERLFSMNALLFGKTYAGQQVWDGMRAIDYLLSRGDVKEDGVGATGFSMGGFITYFLAALDERVRCAVPGGALSTYRGILEDRLVLCQDIYVPGILHEFEIYDVYSLAAPRAMLIVAGTGDQMMGAEAREAIISACRRSYELLGASDRFEVLLEPVPHKFTPTMMEKSREFFLRHLG